MADRDEKTIDNLEEGELAFDGHFSVAPGAETVFTGRKCFLAVGDRLLMKDSCIALMKGHCYGLIGENGCGKSSLLRAIRDTMEYELEGKGGFTFSLVSQDSVEELDKEDQTPWELLVDGGAAARKIEDQIAQLEAEHGDHTLIEALCEQMAELDTPERAQRGKEALALMGFRKKYSHIPIRLLSGGWKTRLSLAAALAARPNVLMLDEPTNHLDLHAILGLVSLLRRITREEQVTTIVVSHDAAFLDLVCTDMMSLHEAFLQQIPGNYSVFEEKAGEYRRYHEGLYERRVKEEERIKKTCREQRDKAASRGDDKAVKQAASRERKAAERVGFYREDGKRFKMHSLKILDMKALRLPAKAQPVRVNKELCFRLPSNAVSEGLPERGVKTLLSLNSVSLGYQGKCVVENVTLSICAGDRVGLVGRNGSGKSTLMSTLYGQSTLPLAFKPSIDVMKGRVDGNCRVALLDQNQLTVLEQYEDDTPLSFLKKRHSALFNKEEVRQHLAAFGMAGELSVTPIRGLSGGLRVRLLLCDLFCADVVPDVLLLDEPTNHLDAETTVALANALKNFTVAVVTVSHNCAFLLSVCKDLWTITTKVGAPSSLSIQRESNEGDFATFFEAFAKTILKKEDHPALSQMLTVRAVRQSVVIQAPSSQTVMLV